MQAEETSSTSPENPVLNNQQPEEQQGPPTVSKEELDRILRQHVWGAVGVGLVPIPLIDLVGLTSVQLNLLRKLAQVYHIPFFKDTVKNILSSLVGSALPVAIAPGVAASVAKIVPIFGQTAGVLAMPAVGGASTYALGRVFIQHFASGGTFLTFDPEAVKAYYAEMFKEGEQIATHVKQEREAQARKNDASE